MHGGGLRERGQERRWQHLVHPEHERLRRAEPQRLIAKREPHRLISQREPHRLISQREPQRLITQRERHSHICGDQSGEQFSGSG